MRTEDAPSVKLAEYTPPPALIDTVDLDISLHPTETRVRARLGIRPNPDAASPWGALRLDGEKLTLAAPVCIDGKPLTAEAFRADDKSLTLVSPPERAFVLEVETLINPTANTQLMGLYRSGSAYCTQCEAEGFRKITFFLDRPDVLSVYTVRLEAERKEAPILLANGNPGEAGAVPGTDRHFAVWHDPHPKPCYLFALVGGDLGVISDRFTTMDGRDVALNIYTEHGKEKRAFYAMDSLKRCMRWDEEVFGCAYDLDVFNVVAVSDFNMGAMENKGLNVFNDKYVLASPETATDGDYASIEAIIAHEYFHNWTGNRITCRDWFQLCLKEGLTVFRDQEFSADERSRPVKRIADVRVLRSQQFSEDAGPLAHSVRPEAYREINNFYTATVYEKGAEVIRMLKTLIGAEKFREGMDLYFERCDGTAATVEDFIGCFAEVSKRDLSQFMRWYRQAGTPQVLVSSSWDKAAGTLTLDVTQTTPPTPGQAVKMPLHMPLALGLVGADGVDLADKETSSGVLELTETQHRFVFKGVKARPALSLNRGFSAPVQVISDSTDEDLLFLAKHDNDSFNRWQALQTFALRLMVRTIGCTGTLQAEPFAEALKSGLKRSDFDSAYIAQLLVLPTESDIARELGQDVDPDAVLAARKGLKVFLSQNLRDDLYKLYQALADNLPYSPDAASAGRRSLRAVCLDLLGATGDTEMVELARRHYLSASNMTDRMAGLGALMQNPGPAREEALDDFYQRFQDDALVIDKWFTLQATLPEAAVLERIKGLMNHSSFTMGNPNRVRSLIGAFAMSNASQFNRLDGAGYAFVAEAVFALDAKNPQVAARLLSSFKSWRTLESRRRQLAEDTLRRIAAESLSNDCADIVNRALG